MIKNITIVSCHSRVGGNLDTCFRRYDTKFVSPNSIGFTIRGNPKIAAVKIKQQAVYLDRHATSWLAMTTACFCNLAFLSLVATFKLP
ncbi:hypothetical protein [Candidatus Tisiphia endosymbiont of Hybos culiciformis]|uniref:hypothetical protein n=1 Tax=Candidatus Tisiphia endosymbiont of Hybos culiciformis TaxID=3139331 RepID=UPI003CCB6F87